LISHHLPKSIEFPKAIKQEQINGIKQFFANERGEEISDFQASILY